MDFHLMEVIEWITESWLSKPRMLSCLNGIGFTSVFIQTPGTGVFQICF